MSTMPLDVMKRRADSVLEEVFRALFEDIDVNKVRAEVEALRKSAPDFSPARHSRTIARRTAIRCAAAGAVTGIPLGLASIGTLGADLAYLVFQQFRMVLGIAAIYGHDLTKRERFNEALSCLAYATGLGAGKQGLAMLGSLMRDRITKVVPFVGVVSGGAINYAAVYAVARHAIRYYDSRVDDAVAEEIWAEGDREHA